MDTSSEHLSKAFEGAPAYVKEYINSGAFEDFARTLPERFSLHVDVAEEVANEIFLVLLGVETPADLEEALRNEFTLSNETVSLILDAVNADIFIPLREKLKNENSPIQSPKPPQEEEIQKPAPQLPQTLPPVSSYTLAPEPAHHIPALAHPPTPIPIQLHAVLVPQHPTQTHNTPQESQHPHFDEMLTMVRTMAKDIEMLKAERTSVAQAPFLPNVFQAPKENRVETQKMQQNFSAPKSGGDPYREPVE